MLLDNHVIRDSARPTRGLFWFRHDLRFHDQVVLSSLCQQVDELTLLFIIDDSWFVPNSYGIQPVGEHRFNFLIDTIEALNEKASALGHSILTLKGQTPELLVSLLSSNAYTHIGVTEHGGYNERREVEAVSRFFPNIEIVTGESSSLFNQNDLPFNLEVMPDVFTPFKRKIESAIKPCEPVATLTALPTPFTPDIDAECQYTLNRRPPRNQTEGSFVGGEDAALSHLNSYLFEWKVAASYKETRNALDNWRDSTKLSPWLATGALSARYVIQEVKQYEQNVVKNDSTYWIYFELLWREYFYWLQQKFGPKWFQFDGIKSKTPNTSHNHEVFVGWCNGQSGYPIVDACMRQLASTGYMSNRGRQLVASCFVNELRQDWRYGAAWFESQLLDYDVASNWGNWLYLAGVGTDPRENRQFNLQKQTEIYDPKGDFCAKWLD